MSQTKKKAEKESERSRYHHGDLRQALIDGALEIIGEGNMQALSLRALARRVGVSYAAPYHHFADKTELIAELAADGFKKLFSDMQRYKAECSDDPKEFLLAAGRAYLFFAISHPAHYRVMFSLPQSDEHSAVRKSSDHCFLQLVQDTAAVLGANESEDAVVRLANVIWATVHGAATLWNDGPMCDHIGGVSTEEYVDTVTSQLTELVVALAEKQRRNCP